MYNEKRGKFSMLIITAQFIESLKNNDEDAFFKLYNEYVKLIYHIAYSYTYNKEDSEDIVNEVFMKIMKSLDSYNHQNKFKEWICQITRNCCINHITRNKDRNNIHNDEIINDTPDQRKQSRDMIELFEEYLDEDTCHIMILRFLYNYKFKEIASILGMTIGKVQGLYYDGLSILRKVCDNNAI